MAVLHETSIAAAAPSRRERVSPVVALLAAILLIVILNSLQSARAAPLHNGGWLRGCPFPPAAGGGMI